MGGCTDVVWMAMVSYSGLASLPLALLTTRCASLVEVGIITVSLYGQRIRNIHSVRLLYIIGL